MLGHDQKLVGTWLNVEDFSKNLIPFPAKSNVSLIFPQEN
jgi:hypothetical protein